MDIWINTDIHLTSQVVDPVEEAFDTPKKSQESTVLYWFFVLFLFDVVFQLTFYYRHSL
jgi:hypothetical protein